jgi:hypothetical protein
MSDSLERRVEQLEQDLKTTKAALRTATDKQEIYDTLMRYCRGIDRCDPELVSSTTPENTPEDCKAITDWLRANTKMTMHFIGNCLIDVHGDEAESETYFISYHLVDRDGKEYLRSKAARYFHTWERSATGWISTGKTARDEWNSFVEIAERAPGAESWFYGERSHDDPAFAIREALARMLAERETEDDQRYAGYTGPRWR